MEEFFQKIVAVDKELMERCKATTKRNFTLVGAMAFGIFLLSSFSIYYTLCLLPKDYALYPIARMVLGLMLGYTIFNYYRFTFSNFRMALPFERSTAMQLKPSLNAWLFRIFFFSVFAFMISKGLELYIYESSIDSVLRVLVDGSEEEKIEMMKRLDLKMDRLTPLQTNGIFARYIILKNLLGYKFIFTTIPAIILFLTPLFIFSRLKIMYRGEYALQEHKIERFLIANGQVITEEHLKKLFKSVADVDYHSYHNYLDPPFNTMPKDLSEDQIL